MQEIITAVDSLWVLAGGVSVVGGGAYWVLSQRTRQLQHLSDSISVVVVQRELDGWLATLSPEQRQQAEAWILQIRGKPDGPVRVGHLLIMNAALAKTPIEAIERFPPCMPEAGEPYRIDTDPGFECMREFVQARMDGNEMDARRALERGITLDSPCCLHTYGINWLESNLAGLESSPEALTYLERAVAAGWPAGELALLLLQGERIPQDIARAETLLATVKGSLSFGQAASLAELYWHGVKGLHADQRKALVWMLRSEEAKSWGARGRRLLMGDRCWVSAQLGMYQRIREQVGTESAQQKAKMLRQMVKDIRMSKP